MRRGLRWGIGLWALILPLLAACEVTNATPSASTSQNEAVLGLPTRTVKPIISFTPRFTATPIPSATLTPSETPIPTYTGIPPTLTPTPSPTFTPTAEGIILSSKNVNLRDGPGLDYQIVMSVPPGTHLGVLDLTTDEQGNDWYEVAYTTEEGEVMQLWVNASLVDTEFEPIALSITPGPGTPNYPLAPTPGPHSVNILAYCRQKGLAPPQPTTDQKVYIEWSWFVSIPEYMDQHLKNANYEVRLDDELLENWEDYTGEMKSEAGYWIIYWYYPVGKLSAGEHQVTFRLTWDEAITDGYHQYGPGTSREADEGDCTFTVVEP